MIEPAEQTASGRGAQPGGERAQAPGGDTTGGDGHQRVIAMAVVWLGIVAGLALLYVGRILFLPLATAILISLVLRPLSRRLHHHWLVPYPLSALVMVLLIASAGVITVYSLQEPAAQWLEEAPRSLRQLQYRIFELKQPIDEVRKTAEELEELGKVVGGDQVEVVVSGDGLSGKLLTELREAAVGVGLTLVILFFVLGWGDRLYRGLVNAFPRFASRRKVIEITRKIEQHVSVYLVIITGINFVLGVVIAITLHLLGMPNPVLWGVMAGVLNYIPYLGPTFTALVLSFVAMLTYPTLDQALLIPLVFLSITSLEGYVVTPLVVGTRLTLNPLVILVSLIFWFWIWGIIGGLLTVPLLFCIKIVLEHVAGRRIAAIIG